MKNILVPSLLAASLLSVAGIAHAQAAESTLSFNAGVVSDYRYRGISQSRLEPAVQGGVDYSHKSGLYVGAWASTIKWIKDSGGDANIEVDLYGGYKGVMGDVSYDVGFLRYEYSGNKLASVPGFANANTNEIYGGLTYGLFTAKYSHALTNLFGNPNSKDSYYVDLSAAFDLGNGYTLTPHVGYQSVKNSPQLSYTDYSVALGKDLGNGLSVMASLVGTDADKSLSAFTTPNGKFTGRTGAVVGLKYTF